VKRKGKEKKYKSKSIGHGNNSLSFVIICIDKRKGKQEKKAMFYVDILHCML
jgi:hypothetical protein